VSAVDRPWPGKCFTTGVTPASARPREKASPYAAALRRVGAEGAVADDTPGASAVEVEHRREVEVDAEPRQPGAQGRGVRAHLVGGGALGEPARRRRPPDDRARHRHAAALLVGRDQQRTARTGPQAVGERPHLRGGLHVAVGQEDPADAEVGHRRRERGVRRRDPRQPDDEDRRRPTLERRRHAGRRG
jgi:hypothetical protein